LIDSRDTYGYIRCGRTDRGVSTLRQVVGLCLRSVLTAEQVLSLGLGSVEENEQVVITHRMHPGNSIIEDGKKELNYCEMLNRVLPDDIRPLAWVPVSLDFSARFSAASRTYRYFFIPTQAKTGQAFNIQSMRDASQFLIGEHDFRHFCIEHLKKFTRIVYILLRFKRLTILPNAWFLQIRGQAFLWQMVRCIVAILFAVAQRHEQPSVIDSMLDISTTPRRPQYRPANEFPLVLHDCQFDTSQPLGTPETLTRLDEHLEYRARASLILATKRLDALDSVRSNLSVQSDHLSAYLYQENDEPQRTLNWGKDALARVRTSYRLKLEAQYIPLLHRQGGMTYYERIQNMGARKRERLDANERKRQDAESTDRVFHAAMRKFG